MGLFSFIKGVGKKIFGNEEAERREATEAAAEARAAAAAAGAIKARKLAGYLEDLGLSIEDLEIRVNGESVSISGKAGSQEIKEKAISAMGNVEGVGQVEDNIMVESKEPEARYYTVQGGDSLSKIAKAHYGDFNKYHQIFEANKPMLSDPDKIYPGQVLRIPNLDA